MDTCHYIPDRHFCYLSVTITFGFRFTVVTSFYHQNLLLDEQRGRPFKMKLLWKIIHNINERVKVDAFLVGLNGFIPLFLLN